MGYLRSALLRALQAALAVVDGFHDVPSQNSVANSQMRDVIGNKTDGHTGNSIYSKSETIEEHLHPQGIFCYPERANAITVTAAAGSWGAYPTPTEIIPANTITSDFDLHFLFAVNISAIGQYSVAVYSGTVGNEVKIGCKKLFKSAGAVSEGSRVIGTKIIAANSRISIAISSSGAGADTIDFAVEGHTY